MKTQSPEGSSTSAKSLFIRIWNRLQEALRRQRQLRRSRRALERLTETELRDIGLTRNQALTEYRKSLYIE